MKIDDNNGEHDGQIIGLWQSAVPSRFVDEAPEENVEMPEQQGRGYGGQGNYDGQSRFDRRRRTETNRDAFHREPPAQPGRRAMTIEGEVLAKSTGAGSRFGKGGRVFHQKFGPDMALAVDGNKLTVDFDRAGRKMVLESFLQAG